MAEGSWLTALKRAFLYHWNLLFVAVVGVGAAISGRPDVVLPLAGAAEIAYLALLSSNRRFQRLAGALEPPSGSRERGGFSTGPAEILAALPMPDRARYQRLDQLCSRLRSLAAGSGAHESLGLPDLQVQNVERLLRIYLRLLEGKNTLERYFATVDEDDLLRNLDRARLRLAALEAGGEEPARAEKLRETLLDTVASIEARQNSYRQVRKNHDSILLELERLDTRIAGLAESGIERKDAAGVGREIEVVTSMIEDTERTMREIQDFAGAEARDRAGRKRRAGHAATRGLRT